MKWFRYLSCICLAVLNDGTTRTHKCLSGNSRNPVGNEFTIGLRNLSHFHRCHIKAGYSRTYIPITILRCWWGNRNWYCDQNSSQYFDYPPKFFPHFPHIWSDVNPVTWPRMFSGVNATQPELYHLLPFHSVTRTPHIITVSRENEAPLECVSSVLLRGKLMRNIPNAVALLHTIRVYLDYKNDTHLCQDKPVACYEYQVFLFVGKYDRYSWDSFFLFHIIYLLL